MPHLLTIPWFKLEGITIPGTSIGIQPFGVLVALGVILGARLAQWKAKKDGIDPETVSDCATHVVLIGFIVGHIFDLAFYEPYKLMHEPWRIFFIWENLSSFGGVFGSVLGGFVWKWRRKQPLLPVYDAIGFGFPLGWVFGRMGCFVVHDHPGAETDFFLGVADYQYPGLPVATRHDLGLYEVFWALAVVGLFMILQRKPRPYGFYPAMVAILYGPFRYPLDSLRAVDATYGGLTPGHYASIASLVVGIVLMVYAYRTQKPAQSAAHA